MNIDGAVRFFSGGQGKHALPEEAITAILGARHGLAPTEAQTKAIADAGGDFSGGVGDALKGAPDGGSLIDAIQKNVRTQLFSLTNAWSDRQFPKRLEQALRQQEELVPKMRDALLTQTKAHRAASETETLLKTQLTSVSEKAEAAVKAGDDATATRWLEQKVSIQEQLTGVTKAVEQYGNDVRTTQSQLVVLENKIEIDKTKSQLLLAQWNLKRDLKDLSADAQKALKDLNGIEGDALTNARQAEQATKQAQRNIDDLLRGGGVRVPGTDTPSTPPSDTVQAELEKLKQAAGRA